MRKVLVANRGEIAIRAFRAINELGYTSVAVFPYEDRYSLHRQKADESYEIGERGHPLRAYLDIAGLMEVAQLCGADSLYPGYGFLSENPDAGPCLRGGAGSPLSGLRRRSWPWRATRSGPKRWRRRPASLSLAQRGPPADVGELAVAGDEIGFPLFVKAAAGGGGRGLRRVDRREDLKSAVEAAVREAETAFGDPTVFLEEAVKQCSPYRGAGPGGRRRRASSTYGSGTARSSGATRKWSRSRRHPTWPGTCGPSCAPTPSTSHGPLGYQNAGTVEFLVGADGRYVFIEMNPRIQVEHTVTEEVTGVDLVQAQLQVAAGATLADLDISQDRVTVNGAALQCRITTEDPARGFRPDTGRLTAYRSPGGHGVRLDGSTYLGADVSPHFDSLLVKLTCRGRTFPEAVTRARRAWRSSGCEGWRRISRSCRPSSRSRISSRATSPLRS